MTGFKAQLPPPPPRVLAARGQVPCGEQPPDKAGVYCMRPGGHAGGHLSVSPSRYWQAEVPAS